jgi:hypothetical protein
VQSRLGSLLAVIGLKWLPMAPSSPLSVLSRDVVNELFLLGGPNRTVSELGIAPVMGGASVDDGPEQGVELGTAESVAPLVRVPRCQNDERGSLGNVAATIKIPGRSSFREGQQAHAEWFTPDPSVVMIEWKLSRGAAVSVCRSLRSGQSPESSGTRDPSRERSIGMGGVASALGNPARPAGHRPSRTVRP